MVGDELRDIYFVLKMPLILKYNSHKPMFIEFVEWQR